MKTDIYEQTYFPFMRYAVRSNDDDDSPAPYVRNGKSHYVTIENASVYSSIEEAESIVGTNEIIVPVYR